MGTTTIHGSCGLRSGDAPFLHDFLAFYNIFRLSSAFVRSRSEILSRVRVIEKDIGARSTRRKRAGIRWPLGIDPPEAIKPNLAEIGGF